MEDYMLRYSVALVAESPGPGQLNTVQHLCQGPGAYQPLTLCLTIQYLACLSHPAQLPRFSSVLCGLVRSMLITTYNAKLRNWYCPNLLADDEPLN
jgi:hypothetical protein